jgi:predicted membrane GTPase involved in stress response
MTKGDGIMYHVFDQYKPVAVKSKNKETDH